MKFCAKCGNQNADQAQACQACGNPFGVPFTPGQNQQMYAQGYGAGPEINSTIIQRAKTVLSSPIALVAIILFTLSAVLSIFQESGFTNIMMNAMRQSGSMSSSDMAILYSVFSTTGIVTKIITALPSLLVVLGMWLTFAGAFNKNGNPMSTAGLIIIKVITIIQLVFVCLLLALLEILMIVGLAASGEAEFLIPMIIFLIVFVLPILYYVMAIKTENAFKRAVAYGQTEKKPSAFLAVMMILVAVCSVIGVIISIVGGSFVRRYLGVGSLDVVSMIVSLCTIVSYILFAVMIFMYRGKMSIPAGMPGYPPVQPMNMPPRQNSAPAASAPQAQRNAQNQPQGGFVPPAPPAQGKPNFGETTVLSNVVTCAGCGTQFSIQEAKCPSCGRQR